MRFIILLEMNYIYFNSIKRVKKCSLTHPTTYQFTLTQSTLLLNYVFSSVNLHSCLTTFFIFCQFTLSLIYVFYQIRQFTPFLLFLYLYLLTMSTKKTFDPNAMKRPVTRSKTAHEKGR